MSTPPEPTGVWFAVDVGTVRVGVARSDPRGVLALPVATLARRAHGRDKDADIAELADLIAEYEAVGVVVGLPRTLAGREGKSAEMARDYGERLAGTIEPIPVRYLDERLTTVSAQRKLRDNGVTERSRRDVIDQAAAVELLQHWLEIQPG
jgi:putative Holliday junction resolvase